MKKMLRVMNEITSQKIYRVVEDFGCLKLQWLWMTCIRKILFVGRENLMFENFISFKIALSRAFGARHGRTCSSHEPFPST